VDLKISGLPPLAGALLQAADPLAIADLSASETKKVTVKDLVQGGVALIDDGSIPGAKVNFTPPPGSISTTALANGSVTAVKLADSSTAVIGAGLPAAGAFIGQLAVAGGKTYIWDGAWQPLVSAGSVNVVLPDTTGNVTIGVVQANDSVALSAELADTTAAKLFYAGPTTAGGATTAREIVGADLPTATASEQGVVKVSGDGLRMVGGRIEVDNDIAVTPSGEAHLAVFNSKGLATSTRLITASDLPLATAGAPGIVMPGSDLVVQATGQLDHEQKVPGGSTFAKVTVNATGHVTGGSALVAADIPGLDASKIITGVLNAAQIANRSITSDKLADYAIAYIQDTQPANTNTHHNGMLWLNPLAQQIRMWDGNVWVPIGVGALSEQNLRFCGLFDATDGKITILTQFGRDAGYKVGDVLPTATDQLTGCYFVVDTAGNGTAVTPGVAYDPGDWCICLGVAQGWSRVDTLSGGGGGGGSSTLDGLIDVDAPSPSAGQALQYDGAVWKPVTPPDASTTVKGRIELATQAEVDAGTDTVRAVTPATLKQYVATASPAPADASTTVKGVIQLATAAEVLAGTDALKAVTPKEAKDHYLAKNIALLAALP